MVKIFDPHAYQTCTTTTGIESELELRVSLEGIVVSVVSK